MIEVKKPPMLGIPEDPYFWQTVARHQFYRLSSEERRKIVRSLRAKGFNEANKLEELSEEAERYRRVLSLRLGLAAVFNTLNNWQESIKTIEGKEEFMRKSHLKDNGLFNFLHWLAIDY